MRACLALLFVAGGTASAQPVDMDRVLARIAEEAGVLSHAAHNTIGQETLRQKAVKPRPRFRFRVGESALKQDPIEYQTREIVSEYGFTTFSEAPGALHELRQVISVDGKEVQTPTKARETLALGMRSADDRRKKKMLQEFAKYGLVGAVMDFGQLLLMFDKRSLPFYSFKIAGKSLLGADAVLILTYEQVQGDEPVTIFEGRTAIRQKLQGSILVRESDFLPLRITLEGQREESGKTTRMEGIVDYVQSRFGVLLPASVVYREHQDEILISENIFQYSDFRQFGAVSDIKFEVEPDQPK